jgi:hypothetical protein
MKIIEKKACLVRYKGGRCLDCGNIFPQCCYDFDHRIPLEKSFTISGKMGKPLSELMIESDKCDLVCANCHRIRTAGNPLISEKMKIGGQSRPSWNRGKKCPKISEGMRGNTNGKGGKGRIISSETRDRIRKTLKARGIQPSVAARKAGGKARQAGI